MQPEETTPQLQNGGPLGEADELKTPTLVNGSDEETESTAREQEATERDQEAGEDTEEETSAEEEEEGQGTETDEAEADEKTLKARNEAAFARRKAQQLEEENRALKAKLQRGDEPEVDDFQEDTERRDKRIRPESFESLGVGPRPQWSDFDDVAEYEDALFDWREEVRSAKERQASVKREQREQSQQAKERLERNAASFVTKEEQFVKRLTPERKKEYHKATEQLSAFLERGDGRGFTNPIVADALFRAGPETVFAFSKDLEKASEIIAGDPVEALLEIGRVQARATDRGRLGRAYREPPTEPEPRIKGSGATKVLDIDRMTDKEYRAYRNKQDGIA